MGAEYTLVIELLSDALSTRDLKAFPLFLLFADHVDFSRHPIKSLELKNKTLSEQGRKQTKLSVFIFHTTHCNNVGSIV